MQAFPNWTQTPVLERSRVLLRLAPILRQSSDEMAIMETRDTGKALSETSTVDIAGGADVFTFTEISLAEGPERRIHSSR